MHLKSVKKMPENSYISYKSDLMKMADFMEKRGVTKANDVTVDGLQAYIRELSETNYATSSIIRQCTSIRAFFKYLVENGNIGENPAEDLKSPKPMKKNVRILSDHEINSLLSQRFADNALGKRDRAILELMYATGLRASELIDLKLSNIDLSLGCLRMDEDRLIPYGNKAKEALGAYLLDARKEMLKDSAELDTENVFFNCNGSPMSRQGLWKLIKKYCIKAGIDKSITLGDLRHSFGVHLVENGADISTVQAMMGYTGANSLTRYLSKTKESKDPYNFARLRN